MSPRRLRVAFDNSLPARNQTGGTGVYAAQLIRHITAAQDVELTVFSGWGAGSGASGLVRKLRAAGHLLWSHGYFPLVLRAKKFDVMHAPAFVTSFRTPCPTVVTVHDLSVVTQPHQFGWGWRTYLNSLMPAVLRSAGGIICISESTKRDLLRVYDVPQAKVHVVYHGLDHSRFHPGVRLDCNWARSIGIQKEYVLHVGVFSERKNIPVLLHSIARLRDQGQFDQYQLVLAGIEVPGVVGARQIDDTIRELNLQDIVLKPGHVPNEQLPGLYAGARVLAMPSSYEGFGFPVLEAMAVGTPVVASNVSSLPEIAEDAALLVPPGDEVALAEAIHELLEDNQLRAELRAKGLKQAQKFSWSRTAEETVRVYRAVARP